MKRSIVAMAGASLLLLASQAFALSDCITGCWVTEPCDGYCVDTTIWEGCGDQWVIVQACEPYQSTLQANAASPAQAEARLFRELRAVAPTSSR